jgi:hypothetical protein
LIDCERQIDPRKEEATYRAATVIIYELDPITQLYCLGAGYL